MSENLSFHTQYNIDEVDKFVKPIEEVINEPFDTNPVKEVTEDELSRNIDDWVLSNIGSNFEFREYQKDTIINILLNILNNKNHTQIIEAPTGSGKSLLNIISAGVLADIYGKTSYILVSDLYLWKQYDDFIRKHNVLKKKIGILKGQTGNYICNKNGEDMRNADCRMAGISWAKMFDLKAASDLGYGCAAVCPYIKARKKALKSKVVIMTYQLYHYMINVVQKTMPGAKFCFSQRDTLFMDECHNIPGIVKNNFAPEIKYCDLDQFKAVYDYNNNAQLDLFDDYTKNESAINNRVKWSEIKERFDNCWKTFTDEHASEPANQQAIFGYVDLFDEFAETIEQIESDLQYKRQVLKEPFTEEDKRYYKGCSYLRNCMCFWSDFKMCVAQTGIEYVIKEIEENRNTKQKIVKFSDVKEDFLCWYFLLRTSRNHVMMSATIGGYDAFYENVGLNYIETSPLFGNEEEIDYTVIPSTFDFTNSPVYFLNRYKMSYACKEQSFKSLKPIIYSICEKSFPDVKGMIQTGSYANAKEIYDSAPPHIKKRLLMYDGSKEKGDKITFHQMSKDTILIGPTLVEGIDLPGDDCRFIIILKVPYPVIVDKYVKEKMILYPKWYNSTTSNVIIQGIGRGNRFREDWCKTYILDACFLSLYNSTKDQYPIELQQRIKFIN